MLNKIIDKIGNIVISVAIALACFAYMIVLTLAREIARPIAKLICVGARKTINFIDKM